MGHVSRRRVLCLLGVGAAAGCSGKKKPEPAVQMYQLRGEVMRLDPQSQVAVIKHENIEGWMEAMTMEFPVKDKAEFAKLTAGKRIRATVHVQDLDYWLADIQPE